MTISDERTQPDNASDDNPSSDGPKEVEDAARQEMEYPEDETDEG